MGYDPDILARAVGLLRQGRLVAIPTETVYGLAADATNAQAVRRIFQAKGRPITNPLIVHIASSAVARRFAADWPDAAQALAEHFWPGPLTLILPKAPAIVDEATAGLSTVGLRVPQHPLTLELLEAFDGPLAAPSANRSTRVSPTMADHVRAELGEAVDLILDGGECEVGIESTVLDLTVPVPAILRPGGISREQIEDRIGPVDMRLAVADPARTAASPGQHAIHYSPATPAFRYTADQASLLVSHFLTRIAPSAVLCIRPLEVPAGAIPIAMPPEPAAYARLLYGALRELDSQDLAGIFVEMPPDTPEWLAVRDRLNRATKPI